jgi:hypothetical protein
MNISRVFTSSVRLLLHVATVGLLLLLLLLLRLVVVGRLRVEIGRQVGMRQEMMLLLLLLLVVLLLLLLMVLLLVLLMVVVEVVVLLLLLLLLVLVVVSSVGHRIQILIVGFSVTERHADSERRVDNFLVLLLVRMMLLDHSRRTGTGHHFSHSGLHRVAQRAVPS